MRVILYLADENDKYLIDYALSHKRTRRMKNLKGFNPVYSMMHFQRKKVTYLGAIDETR